MVASWCCGMEEHSKGLIWAQVSSLFSRMACFARLMFALACLLSVAVGALGSEVNYADVRTHVSHAFEERAHEMMAIVDVLQDVSKATLAGIEAVKGKCGIAG